MKYSTVLIALFTSLSLFASEPFDTIYFGQDEANNYFLLNGRQFTDEKYGYVNVKIESKDGAMTVINPLLTNVWGFSGGMAHDQAAGKFYYTEADGQGGNALYEFNSSEIWDLIIKEENTHFDFLARPVCSFDGLSMKLFLHDDYFVYYNAYDGEDSGSFTIDRANFEKESFELAEGCVLQGVTDKQFHVDCEGEEKTQDIDALRLNSAEL